MVEDKCTKIRKSLYNLTKNPLFEEFDAPVDFVDYQTQLFIITLEIEMCCNIDLHRILEH